MALGVATQRDLSAMTLGELQSFSNVIEEDVFTVLTLEGQSPRVTI